MAIKKYTDILFKIRMIFMPDLGEFLKYLCFIIYPLNNAFGR